MLIEKNYGESIFRKIGIILLLVFLLSSCSSVVDLDKTEDISSIENGYSIINVQDLQVLMEKEDITLINVHFQLDGNITDTDLEIPFDDIENYLDLLPENNEKR